LQLPITEKTYAPPTLNFRVQLQGSDVSELDFGVGARLTLYDIGRYGSEWRNDANLGINSSFATEYYRPIGSRGFLSHLGLYRGGMLISHSEPSSSADCNTATASY